MFVAAGCAAAAGVGGESDGGSAGPARDGARASDAAGGGGGPGGSGGTGAVGGFPGDRPDAGGQGRRPDAAGSGARDAAPRPPDAPIVGCATACSPPHAVGSCPAGTCTIGSCEAGYANCNMRDDDGCEARTDSVDNCGRCGIRCANPHGMTSCAGGQCAPVCDSGWDDCDGDRGNGCETSLASTTSCGRCGQRCELPGATETCATGSCAIQVCDAGRGDCNGRSDDGCETATDSATNCGRCGQACSNPHGGTACASGTCAPRCDAGYGDCDGNPGNGCETALTSTMNCGMCGRACAANQTCVMGSCAAQTCPAGRAECDGNMATTCETPVDTTTDCGSCGSGCTNAHGSTACTAGRCAPACAAGFGDCDGNPGNGCETALDSATHCGACNAPCARTNADATCNAGTCAITQCRSGYANCDGGDANGCEKALTGHSNAQPGEDLGSVEADAFSGFPGCGGQGCNLVLSRTGSQGRFFQMRGLEGSSCSSWVNLRFQLDSPAGVDYDLYVSGGCHCNPTDCRSIALSGQPDQVDVWCDDSFGGDDSFSATVEVRYASGTTCGGWTLRAYRQQCE